jgi:hypothetical protein
MTNDQPTQPLTGFELDNIEGRWQRYVALRDEDSMETSVHDVPDLLTEVDRLRAENAAQASKLAHFEAQHQPVTFDWSASPKCKSAHGPSWVNWPCPDAFALGMTKGDNDA